MSSKKINKTSYQRDFIKYNGIDSSIRESLKLSQDEVSSLSNGSFSKRTLITYENGSRNASANNLMILAQILDTSVDSLLGLKSEVAKSSNNISISVTEYIPSKGLREIEDKNYSISIDSNIVAYKLTSTSNSLNIPKGANLIIDILSDPFESLSNDEIVVLMISSDNSYCYPTKLIHKPTDRIKNNYLYIDEFGSPNMEIKRELESKVLGVIKKVIIAF